ncbi:MAG: NAD(P)/FAD-dependent oxidoreductase [Candidatus Schekmanbacteria bacterium]|nr:NAD(P)/FAD-dependent oxidoreductase [Candidatus Schekmanbacteria bacterium]
MSGDEELPADPVVDSQSGSGRADVVVIGAGPAGSTAAERLARGGASVVLLEKDHAAGETTVCGGAMPFFLRDKLALERGVVDRIIYTNRVGTLARNTDLRFDTPNNLSVRRELFDAALAEKARAAGARMLARTLATGLEMDPVAVRARNRDSGAELVIPCRLIVFADGPHTLAQAALGIGFRRAPGNHAVALEWDLEAPGNDLQSLEFYFELDALPLGYYWVFPKKDILNVGLGTMEPTSARELAPLLSAFIDSHPALRGRPISRKRGGLIPLRPARRVAKWPGLVVGDAGGFVNPMTGAGLTYAIWSGEVAARTCLRALATPRREKQIVAAYRRELRRTPHALFLAVTRAVARAACFASRFRLGRYALALAPALVEALVRGVWVAQKYRPRSF